MKEILSDLFAISMSLALIVVFAIMRITGRYVAIEDNMYIYGAEMCLFVFIFSWGIYSIVGKFKR